MWIYLAIFALTLLLVYRWWKLDALNALPGPKGIPVFGNALQMKPDDAHLGLTKWAKEYGGIYKLSFPMATVIILSGAKELREALVTRGKDFASRGTSFRAEIIFGGFDITSCDWNNDLKWRRKFMHAFIKQFGSGMEKIEKVTTEKATDLITVLKKKFDKKVDLKPLINTFVTEVIAAMLLGEAQITEEDVNSVKRVNDDISKAFALGGPGEYLDMFPMLRFFKNETYSILLSLKSFLDVASKRWIKRVEDSKSKEGFIRKCLNLSSEERAKYNVSDKVLEHLIWQFMLAGSMTTNVSLCALMNILIHHPNIQAKLQHEVDEVIGEGFPIHVSHRSRMNYHQAVLLELMRYHSSVPFLVPHKTVTDTSIGEYKIPKDTDIWGNLWALHHDEMLWENPFNYDPQRFLDDNGQLVPADHPNIAHMFPFGAGPRVCIGEVFAQSRMFLFLATMMQNFTLLPATTLAEQTSCDPRQCECGFTLMIPDFEVRLNPRQQE